MATEAERDAILQRRVDDLIARGLTGPAADRLRIYQAQFGQRPWILERLGELLAARGHVREGGCAFFWSGRRDAAAQPLIGEFLAGCRRDADRIVQSLPRHNRPSFDRLPAVVRADLDRLGVTAAMLHPPGRERPAPVPARWLSLGCLLAVTVVLLCLVTGAVTVFRWLVGW